MNFELNKAYNRDSFVEFLSDKFLSEDFRPKRNVEEIILSGSQNFATRAYRLGECRSLELEVFEIHHTSLNDARVGIAKDAFRMLLNHSYCNRALIAFVPEGGKQWRFSLIQIEAELNDRTNRIQRGYSNPRRYSFLLGEGGVYNTPKKYLIELGRVSDFNDLLSRFSVEALTKEFYNELFGWYQWAVSPDGGIYFPNDTATAEDDFEDKDKKIIRLLTRLMFVWFIKQKDLVPDKLFNEKQLQNILKDFDPQATDNGNYYNAILQNLFFATLNRAIEDDEGKRGFAKLQGQRDVKTLYRYAEMFRISEDEVLQLFAEVPFLNGGLFECLDKTKKIDGVDKAFNYDGFSRNPNRWPNGRSRQRAFIPNRFFFDEEKGLLNILKRYNFTIEENTPNEQTVALDPELLGKVFENLLGAYNPETRETARNQSGSFYTPREIVNYMVDESIKAYLSGTGDADGSSAGIEEIIDSLFSDTFEYNPNLESQYKTIANRLKAIKILDPACGSGAFPMGLLNRLVDILQKIDPKQDTYSRKLQIIENCIYGSDIQNIAAQISKLRFFISLICDCEKDPSKPNYGIPTLPNLETKFVTANSLIALHKRPKEVTLDIFADNENSPINLKKKELLDVRHQHFRAKKASEKMRLRKQDETLRAELLQLLEQEDTFAPKDAIQLAKWNPYDQNEQAKFFDPEWMFGVTDGFDIVIGNPPYIQLQNNGGELAELYEPCGYKTFARTGDIYCLFYERGHQLLKQNGHLCYITSNKWMRAGYGEKTREFLANNTDPQLLIDFAGVKIFESATVDTNILLFANGKNRHKTLCAVTNKSNKDDLKQLSDFVRSHSSVCDFSGSDSWVILSEIEQSIKNKIEAIGTPLKDWDIQINYGIKTGFNDAFIISTEKRDEILANCKTEEERQRTADLIRPILRGRDIKRYGYDWADLYLIATFPAKHYDIEQYPAVKQYLLSFAKDDLLNAGYDWVVNDYLADFCKQKLSQTGNFIEIKGKRITLGTTPEKARKRTNNKWFETQDSISYWDDFNKPKIIYPNMTKYMPFVWDTQKFMTNQKCFIITGSYTAFLTAFLNSSLFKYCFRDSFPELQGGTRELSKIFFDKIPVLQPDEATEQHFKQLVDDIQKEFSKEKAMAIDKEIFTLYNLTKEEREQIGYIEIK